ncbi:E3 ubiquitin/ISG15 ligase TRIM25 isoform X2 [Coturnix japonica]|uniref:E3 ubiquitin/ISG15 ligase TRIM25 isoform X2 n=1 Tax=Coturnix japonica TaxID=93934 RepID=UPI0013A5C96C|nr:E3 ubiquitin/ISG15 ligase TRIM25 isoform X2 [Coturnix japonica]
MVRNFTEIRSPSFVSSGSGGSSGIMASMSRTKSEPNLLELEEELTCSICLCIFNVPVTVPCGHNFCASCLELTWAGQVRDLSCPQCRATFPSRPQLRKNTVLCRVVEQMRGSGTGDGKEDDESEEEEREAATLIYCDSCLQAAATQTCLTCMASFCPEHLRPHHDSPAFRDHRLCPPVRDLQQRKCPQHNKLFEFFCSQHGCCICSLCLLSHKPCHTSTLQEAKDKTEAALKKRLVELHNQSERSVQAMNSVKTIQSQAAETAARKRDLLRAEFMEIKALIEEKENQTLKVVMEEEKRVCNKFDYIYKILGSKKNEIQSLRDQIEMALTEGDDVLFLKRAAALQRTSIKEAFVPVIEMDHNMIHAAYQSAINLKDAVKLAVNASVDKRTDAKPPPGKTKPPSVPSTNKPVVKKKIAADLRTHREKIPPSPKITVLEETDTQDKKNPVKPAPNVGAPGTGAPNAAIAVKVKELITSFLKRPREELMQYAANIMLDFNTAHNKVALSERYTKMSVSDTLLNYNHHPQRFTDCPQVLGFQFFKRGIHYWEVELQQNNFCGIGICYGSMGRQGPDSRLGRNSSSWCIEWFNSKISAWHNDVEKCLPNTKATKIGVLLHCDGGFVLFLSVEEKLNLIYKFKAQFTEAVYPAFWLFSSGTVLSLCQMKP